MARIYIPPEVSGEQSGAQTAEVLVADPRTVVVDGEILASADGGNLTHDSDKDYLVGVESLIPDPLQAERVSEVNEPIHRLVPAGPILRELRDDGHDGTKTGIRDDGEIVPIGSADEFIPNPLPGKGLEPESIDPEHQLFDTLSRDGFGDFAQRLELLGVGLVSVGDLSREEFRSQVTPEEYAGYLFSLTRLYGDMRQTYYEMTSDEDVQIGPAFLEALQLFVGKTKESNTSDLCIEVNRIIEEEKAFIKGITERRTDRIRDRVHVLAREYINRVRVIEVQGKLLLVSDSGRDND